MWVCGGGGGWAVVCGMLPWCSWWALAGMKFAELTAHNQEPVLLSAPLKIAPSLSPLVPLLWL